MALTKVASALQIQNWANGYFPEYIRSNPFTNFMGSDESAIIQLVEDLTKTDGDNITVSFLSALRNDGTTGDNTLEGNEESLGNYGHKLTIEMLRHAVAVTKGEQMKSKIDLMNAAKPALKTWFTRKLYLKIIAALGAAKVDGKTAYASCSEAEKDAWLAANSDRVLFGAALSNNAANDHSTCLATLDTTADKCTATNLSLAKRTLKVCDPLIRPYDTGKEGEWYLALVGTRSMRDLKSSLATIHQNAEVRGKENPIFQDADLVYDGMVIKEVPDIGVYANVGASGTTDVQPTYILGAQAVGVAWGQRPKPIFQERDYGLVKGAGLEEVKGVEKLMCNSKQHGVFTLYCAAAADT